MPTAVTPQTTMTQALYEKDWRNYNTPHWSEEGKIPITLNNTRPEAYPTLTYPIITYILDGPNRTPEPMEKEGHTNYLVETPPELPPPSSVPKKNEKAKG